MKPAIVLAAVAAALIISLGTTARAQTAAKPQVQPKPAAKPQAKPAAQSKDTAAPEVLGRKSVCVASAIGHTFQVKAIGLTIFGNSEENVPIDSWGVDDAAVASVRRILGKDYNVRRLAVSKAAVTAYESSGASYADFLRIVSAGAPRCNIYVLLNRILSNYNGTNQYLAGLGILDGSGIFDRAWLFASFTVRVYDGENFGLLKGVKPTTNVVETLMGGIPCLYRKVEKSAWWPTPPQAAVQSVKLKTATQDLVKDGVAQALKEVFEGA